jgi:hypothetical protein
MDSLRAILEEAEKEEGEWALSEGELTKEMQFMSSKTTT